MKTFIFNLFGISRTKTAPSTKQESEQMNHTFSVKEMEDLYNNQRGLSETLQKVLNAGMWVRAMRANYHGYAPQWPNIKVKEGSIFYFHNGEWVPVWC